MCKQSLSKMTILYGFRCAYCTLKVCPQCFPQFQHDACDEGALAPLKLGPGNIVTHATDVTKKWTITVPEERRPLMVFINKKSGGQVGKLIAQRLSRVLNPNQIVDLSQGGPMPMLKLMQKTKAAYRILACGGDGTAAWLLSALDKMVEEGATYQPPVAVLPLGTGNDLARVLGWGGGYDNESMTPIIENILTGHEVYLDRWRLDVENVGVADGVKHPKIMNNYFSIGIDAKIALDFHRKREANPSQFKSRGINKVIYAGLGATTMFEGLPNLARCLQVELDGQIVQLPKTLEGIMAINLASYAGGKNPWGKPPRSEGRAPQSPCDGLFELIGISSSFHLGQIQTYLVDGVRLGQGRDVTFTWLTDDVLPIQLDGEPWEEPRSVIRISFFCQSRMIASPSESEHWTKAQWLPSLPFSEPNRKKKKNKREDNMLPEIDDAAIASSSGSASSSAIASSSETNSTTIAATIPPSSSSGEGAENTVIEIPTSPSKSKRSGKKANDGGHEISATGAMKISDDLIQLDITEAIPSSSTAELHVVVNQSEPAPPALSSSSSSSLSSSKPKRRANSNPIAPGEAVIQLIRDSKASEAPASLASDTTPLLTQDEHL